MHSMKSLGIFLIWRLLPLLLWCVFIFSLSSKSSLPGDNLGPIDYIFRKLAHMGTYFVLFYLAFRLFPGWKLKDRVLFAVIFAFGYAVSDEMHQGYVPGRTGTPRDWWFDGLGISFGALRVFGLL
ncbi:MAG TPA: VanZ family protein [Patescibacteria group bacterium]|nr:VanZ family protein [Patescibacteria group bacterium]